MSGIGKQFTMCNLTAKKGLRSLLLVCMPLVFLMTCKDDEPENEVINESDEFSVCNSRIDVCSNGNGNYCLFGYKWGSNDEFESGLDIEGPRESGGVVTFSFQEENGLVNTHAQIDLPSESFDNIPGCAKEEIRKALSEWELVADLEFQELDENSDSDIRFFVADIRQSGVGYPNYRESPCDLLGGDVVIQKDLWTNDCDEIRAFMLHEMGHALGLGHVITSNIMSSSYNDIGLRTLQSGDIAGIVEIYGEK